MLGTPAVEPSSVPLSSASDPLSVISQDVSSLEAVHSEVPPSANLQQVGFTPFPINSFIIISLGRHVGFSASSE